jgi:KDO2-lipid IV(A) lauroyltransferase
MRQAHDIVLTFVQFARALTAALAPRRPLFLERRVDLVGEQYVRPFLDAHVGMLLLTAHVGPWDACGLRLRSMMGVPVMMLMSEEPDQDAAAYHDGVRESAQVKVLRVGKSPLDALPLLEHIRQGGIVVAQLDRVPSLKRGIKLPLFSRSFEVPAGLFRVAGALGCPILPVFAARLDSESDRVVVSPPVWVRGRSTDQGLRDAALEVVLCLEEHLRRVPTQWFHFLE